LLECKGVSELILPLLFYSVVWKCIPEKIHVEMITNINSIKHLILMTFRDLSDLSFKKFFRPIYFAKS